MKTKEIIERLNLLLTYHREERDNAINWEDETRARKHADHIHTLQAAIGDISSPPSFMDEALNSGNGTYKP